MANTCELRRVERAYPINGERIDVMGNIWRYNFGWVVETRTSGGQPGAGTIVESATVQLSGFPGTIQETVSMEVLPPSFNSPGGGEGDVTTYCRTGSKTRTILRARAVGISEVYALATVPFVVNETKTYAGMVSGAGGGSGVCTGSSGSELADGGYTVASANGVTVYTNIKG